MEECNDNYIIDENSIHENDRNGIYMYDSDNNNIGDVACIANDIYKNNNNNNDVGDGIYMGAFCYGNVIEKCFIHNKEDWDGYQQYGIHLYYNFDNTIRDCYAGDNIEYNIKDGIFLDDCGNNGVLDIEIRNNYISKNIGNGIRLKDSVWNTISDNSIINNFENGIQLTTSSINAMENNEIYSNSNGVDLYGGYGNSIRNNNYIRDNSGIGVYLYDSDDNCITDNLITNAWTNWQLYGFSLWYSKGNHITDNTIGGTYDGIILHYCGSIPYYPDNSNSIINNQITRSGGAFGCHAIEIHSSVNTILTGNTMLNWGVWIEGTQINHWTQQYIDDPFNNPGNPSAWNQINPTTDPLHYNPVYYITPAQNDQTFDGASGSIQTSEYPGEIILAGCTGVTVKNFFQYSATPPYPPQTMEGSSVGILMGFANNNYIYTNHIHEMQDAGIYLFDSDGNDIEHNKITSTIYEVVRNGIHLVSWSCNNDIESNYIKNVEWYGIAIHENCINNNIFNNILIDNNHDRNQGERPTTDDDAQAFDANPAGTNSWFKLYPSSPNNVGIRDKTSSDFPNCGNYWSDWITGSSDDYDGTNQNNGPNNPDSIIDTGSPLPPSGIGLDSYEIALDRPPGSEVLDDYPFNSYGLRSGGTLELYWDWPNWLW